AVTMRFFADDFKERPGLRAAGALRTAGEILHCKHEVAASSFAAKVAERNSAERRLGARFCLRMQCPEADDMLAAQPPFEHVEVRAPAAAEIDRALAGYDAAMRERQSGTFAEIVQLD